MTKERRTDSRSTPNRLSPINVLSGAWLARERKRRNLTAMALAPKLGVTDSYLRTIESGLNPIPITALPGIVDCLAISFEMAAKWLSMIRILDVKDKDRAYDLSAVGQRTGEPMTRLWQDARRLLEWIRFAAEQMSAAKQASEFDLRESIKSGGKDAPIEILDAVLREKNETYQPMHNSLLTTYQLNPFIADVVDEMASRLAQFPPHINLDSINNWQRTNARKFTKVWGIISAFKSVTNPEQLHHFDFLQNEHAPSLFLGINGNETQAIALQKKLASQLALRLTKLPATSLSSRIQVVAMEHRWPEIQKLLRFDLTQRKIVLSVSDADAQQKLVNRSIVEFCNFWGYETQQNSSQSIRIGMLDNFDDDHPERQFYAVSLFHEDIQRVIKIAN